MPNGVISIGNFGLRTSTEPYMRKLFNAFYFTAATALVADVAVLAVSSVADKKLIKQQRQPLAWRADFETPAVAVVIILAVIIAVMNFIYARALSRSLRTPVTNNARRNDWGHGATQIAGLMILTVVPSLLAQSAANYYYFPEDGFGKADTLNLIACVKLAFFSYVLRKQEAYNSMQERVDSSLKATALASISFGAMYLFGHGITHQRAWTGGFFPIVLGALIMTLSCALQVEKGPTSDPARFGRIFDNHLEGDGADTTAWLITSYPANISV